MSMCLQLYNVRRTYEVLYLKFIILPILRNHIPCECDLVYIGESSRNLSLRLNRGRGRSIIGGAHIHIFVLCIINFL